MRAHLLRAFVASSAPAPAVAPIAAASVPGAAGGVGLGYGITIAVGVLVLISTVMLASYLCVRAKASAGRMLLVDDAPVAPSAVVVLGLDATAIDALYPKFFLHAGGSPGRGGKDDEGSAMAGPCAICLGEFEAGAALRRGPGCVHCFHAGCAERWLRVSATCPVCRRRSPRHWPRPCPSPRTRGDTGMAASRSPCARTRTQHDRAASS